MTSLIFRQALLLFLLKWISSRNETYLIIVIVVFINLPETQLLTDIHSEIRSEVLVFIKRVIVLRHLRKYLRTVIWLRNMRWKSIYTLIVFLFLLKKGQWIISFYILKRSNWLFVYLIEFIFFKLHVTPEAFFYEVLKHIGVNIILIWFTKALWQAFFVYFFLFFKLLKWIFIFV